MYEDKKIKTIKKSLYERKSEKDSKASFLFIAVVIWIIFIALGIFFLMKNLNPIEQSFECYVGQETYMIEKNRLVRTTDFEILLDNLDSSSSKIYTNKVIAISNTGQKLEISEDDGGVSIKFNGENKEFKKSQTQFFIFGMGPREKFIFRKDGNEFYDLVKYSDNKVILDNVEYVEIIPENYTVKAKKDGNEIVIFENENGIYIRNKNEITPLDISTEINIPNFSGKEYERELKILFNEVAVNITKDGIKPNFIAYDATWYRDAAIMAMVLEKTDNVEMITDYIDSITEIYDCQNGVEESDNLGQLLYLLSLTEKPNREMINKIMEEAYKLQDEDGALGGEKTTDGAFHRVYQTRWLKFGMEALKMDSSDFIVPGEDDSYADLIWFDDYVPEKKAEKSKKIFYNRWPYLYYAKSHTTGDKIDFTKGLPYPLSKEYKGSKADFDKLNVLDERLAELKLVAPHGWSAAELFLLLFEK